MDHDRERLLEFIILALVTFLSYALKQKNLRMNKKIYKKKTATIKTDFRT